MKSRMVNAVKEPRQAKQTKSYFAMTTEGRWRPVRTGDAYGFAEAAMNRSSCPSDSLIPLVAPEAISLSSTSFEG